MRRSKEFEGRVSSIKRQLTALSAKETLGDEEKAEQRRLLKELPDVEDRHAAALLTEEEEQRTAEATILDNPDAELRERIELRSKAQASNYLLAAVQGRIVTGAEHELSAAAGVGGIPIELWDVPQPEQRTVEKRDVTPAPGTVGVNLDAIRPAVFARSIASRLGIDMPRVPSGTYASGVVTTSATPAARAKGAAITATAGAITVQTATPKRVSTRLELALEDIAAVGQANFESVLRENISLGLSDALDNQLVNGSGVAPNLAGMFKQLDDPTGTAPATVADFDDFVALFAGGVEGLWATTADQVGIVVNPETYRLSLATFRDGSGGNANRGEISFADYARERYGGWWTNRRMPDKASHIAQCILYRMGRSMMGGTMGMRTAVCPHWGEVSIDDIYTLSANAQRAFTMHVLLGDVLLVQSAAYAQVRVRLSV